MKHAKKPRRVKTAKQTKKAAQRCSCERDPHCFSLCSLCAAVIRKAKPKHAKGRCR